MVMLGHITQDFASQSSQLMFFLISQAYAINWGPVLSCIAYKLPIPTKKKKKVPVF